MKLNSQKMMIRIMLPKVDMYLVITKYVLCVGSQAHSAQKQGEPKTKN